MANEVAAASLNCQQRKRSLVAKKNKGPAVKTVLCTPYVTKWSVLSLLSTNYFICWALSLQMY